MKVFINIGGLNETQKQKIMDIFEAIYEIPSAEFVYPVTIQHEGESEKSLVEKNLRKAIDCDYFICMDCFYTNNWPGMYNLMSIIRNMKEPEYILEINPAWIYTSKQIERFIKEYSNNSELVKF